MGDFSGLIEKLKAFDGSIRPMVCMERAVAKTQSSALSESGAAVWTSQAETAEELSQNGFHNIFFDCTGQTDDALRKVFGKCRFVIRNKAQMQQLDRVVQPLLPFGYLENVVIRLSEGGADATAFTADNIEEFSRWLRFSEALAVRGIVIDLSAADDLSEAARSAFSLIKKIRSDLPCLFHCFCLEGLADQLISGDKELLRTLKMLASLNDTSLYAEFYIA